MEQEAEIFSNRDLKNMILPLFLEQLLVMLVGMADTLVVSYAGEAAVSGVSLVNQFNTIFIYLFTALASGGAVVISQYIGRRAMEDAGESASQLLLFSTVFSIIISVLVLACNEWLLRLLFGRVELDVMAACVTYFRISAYSYPALAVYNSGAAIYRSLGKTDVTMYLSVVSNVINIIGNFIGVFVLRAGVAGVAWPSLIARVFSAVVITVLCFRKKNEVVYRLRWIFRWNGVSMKQILGIAVPNGLENGVFQLVKVALSSIVALFGTYQIAANSVAQSIWSMAALAGVAMGPAFITVIGQCMGNGDIDAADFYFRKLTRITLLLSSAWNLLIFLLTPLFLMVYALEPETKHLVIWLVLIHNVFNAVAFPFSGALSNGLRAAGDVKFTMVVSVFSTLAVRLLLSWLFGIFMSKKILVAYFSASGTTALTAKNLAEAVGAELYEIRPAVPYTNEDLDWTNKKSRSSVEMNNRSGRPALADTDADIAAYDVVFVGFPIWWYVAPTIINTFLESYDFSGKTIIPFATSGGSGMGKTNEGLEKSCPGARLMTGKLLNGVSGTEMKTWAESVL